MALIFTYLLGKFHLMISRSFVINSYLKMKKTAVLFVVINKKNDYTRPAMSTYFQPAIDASPIPGAQVTSYSTHILM